MEKKLKLIKTTTIIASVIMFVCIIVLTCQLFKINNLKEKTNNLQTYKEQLLEDIYNYNTTNAYYDNNRQEYLENYARETLGWGESGEVWYTKK
jgi:cell division protein FtsB